jgi:hypothetical protein
MHKLHNIPLEMKAFKNFILWRLEWRSGDVWHSQKPTKIPYSVYGKKASVSEPQTWSSFEDILDKIPLFTCAKPVEPTEPIFNSGYSGAGFVFSKLPEHDAKLTGIDLDDPRKDEAVIADHKKLIDIFNTYTEYSPSGKGKHLICTGTLPGPGKRRDFVEMYDSGRFFTLTGDVVIMAPAINCQAQINILYKELSPEKSENQNQIISESQPQKNTDDEICEFAYNAANGEKFYDLYSGDWQKYYAKPGEEAKISNNEADFALIDIIAHYTQNFEQVVRIFRSSALGKREKAKRNDYIKGMISRAFDNQPPPIDFDLIISQRKEQIEKQEAEKKKAATRKPSGNRVAASSPEQGGETPTIITLHDPVDEAIVFPPGLMGEVAQFCHDAAPRPVKTMDFAASIAFLAGIVGRQYNVGTAGLNQYIILTAKSARGKNQMSSGLEKIVKAVSTICSTIAEFTGPGKFESPQAVVSWLNEKASCFYSVLGEFGLTIKAMSNKYANSSQADLKSILLDVYERSGQGNALNPSAYAKKENTTSQIASPSVTILGESTPVHLYGGLTEIMISDGTLSRFLTFDYEGPRVAENENIISKVPLSLVEKVASLVAYVQSLKSQNIVRQVEYEDAAMKMKKAFSIECDNLINNAGDDVAAELWGRSEQKAVKLAALFAISENYINPKITVAMLDYAIRIVSTQTKKLQSRFTNFEIGDDGQKSENNKQMEAAAKGILKLLNTPYLDHAVKYGYNEGLWKDGIIPYGSLLIRLCNISVFKNDRLGSTVALKKTLQDMLEAGYLQEVNKKILFDKYKCRSRAFIIPDISKFPKVKEDKK